MFRLHVYVIWHCPLTIFIHLSAGFKLEFITDHSELVVKYLFTVVLLRK